MPQPFNNAVITNSGARLLTRAQNGEIKIQFTRVAIGDGSYAEEEESLSALQNRSELKLLKNSYPVSDISIHSDHCVKVTAYITNQDAKTGNALVEEGYFINEIGLYAKEKDGDEGTEVLYSIATTMGENGDFMPPYNGYNPVQIIQDFYATVNNSAEVTIKCENGIYVPMETFQSAINTVLANAEGYANGVYQQATGYADRKIAGLINGAPSTLDTLGEIAQAMQGNGDVVAALDAAIGGKADEAEFDSHKKAVDGLLGNTDISSTGDGTVTGAIAALSAVTGGWSVWPDELTQAEYDDLPDAVKSTPKLVFVVKKE